MGWVRSGSELSDLHGKATRVAAHTPDRPPGMHDVARAAGVSHQTVSRVLNGSTSVRAETRARVLDVIDQLGYRPNRAARALVTRRSGTIGVVTTRSVLFGPTSVLLSVEAAAREKGYYVSLVSLARASEDEMRSAVLHFLDQSVEGLIVIGTSARFVDAAWSASGRVPTVVVSALDNPPPGLYVATVDHHAGALMAVNHLLGLGHRAIAHLRGPADSLDGTARVRGWRDALSAAGVDEHRLIDGDWSAESGYRAGLQLVREGLPSAVFAGNDEMALGMLRAFAEHGVGVPQDVSVVGFDDIAGAAQFSPPLTTVRQEFDALGHRCLAMLVEAIDGTEPESPALVPPTLLVRSSAAAPPSGRAAVT